MISVVGSELEILVDPGQGLVVSISVAYLITQDCREPDFLDNLRDECQAARTTRGRGVVVEDRGTTPANAIGCGQLCGDADRVPIECAIKAPPKTVEHLYEITDIGSGIEPTRQGRIKVMVQIH
jgi:hypothetical protein